MQKLAAKSSKNEMFVFGLCSTFDDQPSDLSDKSHLKCEKMATKSSKNEMQFAHTPRQDGDGTRMYGNWLGMEQVWDRNGLGDGMIQMDFMQMAYNPADSCAISPSAFLLCILGHPTLFDFIKYGTL